MTRTLTTPTRAAVASRLRAPWITLGRAVVRPSTGNWALQSALDRHGLGPVAGVDEAGRGACAGPLVVAACVLRPGDARRFDGLTDSKLLTAAERDRFYDLLRARALGYSVVVVPVGEVDERGIHVVNIEGMRRAVAALPTHPGYVLTDGFAVPGMTAPNAAVVKGDRLAACIAGASVLAKVTRDRIMADLHRRRPEYGFDLHKGYCTADHTQALAEYGPTDDHRWSWVNVVSAAARLGIPAPRTTARRFPLEGVGQNEVPTASEGVTTRPAAAVPTSPSPGRSAGGGSPVR
jgi:ribonuclease HII